MKSIKIEDYQLAELQDEKLFINRYDMSLMYSYELDRYWKEFFFDVLQELSRKHTFLLENSDKESLLDFFKENWYNIIKENKLNIDSADYIEITDYVSFDSWLKDGNNGYGFFQDGIYLIQK